MTLTLLRGRGQYVVGYDPPLPGPNIDLADAGLLTLGGTPVFDLGPYHEAFKLMSEAIYIGAFRNAITAGGAPYYDLQIGHEFIAAWDRFKSGMSKSSVRAALQVEADIARIFGYRDLEMNASVDGTALHVVIDDEPYLLHELGAGIAQFILVLAFAAVTNPSLILIDEPESSLHPSLQLSFLTALAAHARSGLILATHSIGLARAAAERTFVLRQVGHGESELHELERTPRLSELLGELSFDGYRELGFDAVLLVEGATDVKAVRELLRLYGDERKALVMPLGGGQLVHGGVSEQLIELTRISANIWVLVDSERASANDPIAEHIEAFRKESDDLGLHCHVLERRALENYLSDRAIKEAFGAASGRRTYSTGSRWRGGRPGRRSGSGSR